MGKKQSYEAQFQRIHLQSISTSKSHKSLYKRDQKNKSQRIRIFPMRLCLPVKAEATPIKSLQRGSQTRAEQG